MSIDSTQYWVRQLNTFTKYESPIGMLYVCSVAEIVSIDFNPPNAMTLIVNDFPKPMREIIALIDSYFQKQPISIPQHLFPKGSPFRVNVWHELCKVTFGNKTSYGALAKDVHNPKGARAIGNAVGANPLPLLIPCHRVLASDGKLGGFSGGFDWKIRLLEFESINYLVD